MKRQSDSVSLESFEIRPLIQLGRAAMSSPERSADPLTHEGMIMLLDIIEDLLFPPSPSSLDPAEEVPQAA